jgi:hypothetical protein
MSNFSADIRLRKLRNAETRETMIVDAPLFATSITADN